DAKLLDRFAAQVGVGFALGEAEQAGAIAGHHEAADDRALHRPGVRAAIDIGPDLTAGRAAPDAQVLYRAQRQVPIRPAVRDVGDDVACPRRSRLAEHEERAILHLR